MTPNRKSILSRAAIALGLAVILAALAAGVALAASGVSLLTPPVDYSREVYYNIGETTPDWHYVGAYPAYGAKFLKFSWRRFPFTATVHGSYRVALVQNVTPLAAQKTWVEKMVSHDWADNPAGPVFTMGPFLRGFNLCNNCPSKIVVTAETYQAIQTPGTDDWEIVYSPMPPGTTNPVNGLLPNIVQESSLFVINTNTQVRCDKSNGPDC